MSDETPKDPKPEDPSKGLNTANDDDIEEKIQKAAEEGKLRMIEARPPIKLPPSAPKIAVCIPMGDKDDPDLFECEHCKTRQFGIIKCASCHEPSSARQKLRHGGLAPIEWLLNAWQIVPPLLSSMVIMARKSVLSAQGRNEMTYQAIKIGCKYIFYWDDDVILPPKAIYDMHNAMERPENQDVAAITGIYCTREDMQEPIVYKTHGQGAYWDFDDTPGNLEDIFAAGAGCLMARVDALKEVEEHLGGPWWADEHSMDPVTGAPQKVMWGHDIRFCKRIHDLRETGKSSKPWRVTLAGWIQCYHFDIHSQTMYGLPESVAKRDNKNTASYWDFVWGQEGQGSNRVHPALFDRIVDLVPRGAKVNDIGCGVGILLDRLSKQKQVEGFGIDFSEKSIEMLRSRWLQGEIQDIRDLKLNHFPRTETIAICTETIEHLDDERLERLLEEMSTCKMSIISTPEGDLRGTPDGEHVREFSEESLRKTLEPRFNKIEIEKVQRNEENSYLLAVCSNEG